VRDPPPSALPHSSPATFFPIRFATTGVSATVGGKRIGEAALWAAYANATVPAVSALLLASIPTYIPRRRREGGGRRREEVGSCWCL